MTFENLYTELIANHHLCLKWSLCLCMWCTISCMRLRWETITRLRWETHLRWISISLRHWHLWIASSVRGEAMRVMRVVAMTSEGVWVVAMASWGLRCPLRYPLWSSVTVIRIIWISLPFLLFM